MKTGKDIKNAMKILIKFYENCIICAEIPQHTSENVDCTNYINKNKTVKEILEHDLKTLFQTDENFNDLNNGGFNNERIK